MKKYGVIILAALLVMLLGVTCYAQVVEDEALGVRFELPEDWIPDSGEGGYFYERTGSPETLFVSSRYEGTYLLGQMDEEKLLMTYLEKYSDEQLAKNLGEDLGTGVSVTTEYEDFGMDTFGEQPFYLYIKGYSVQAEGIDNGMFYVIDGCTVKNGYLYNVTYEARDTAPDVDFVSAMLESMSFESGEIQIFVDGERIYPDSAPVLRDGRTLVPIRAVAEKMGYTVGWNPEKQLVTLTSADKSTVLEFTIESDIALKNGKAQITLDVPAVILEDRTYLPLRAVADGMGADIQWNSDERVIEIR